MSRSHAFDPRVLRRTTLLLVALLAAPFASACASSQSSPSDPGASVARPPELLPGTRLLVERAGQWLPAAVVQRVAPDRVRVHYDNSDPAWDEEVGVQRIRIVPAAGANDYRVGEKVLVTTPGRLFLAEVVQQLGLDEWRVHYDGYGSEIAENVKPDRLQRPFAGLTAHPAGEAVAIDVSGRALGATVLAPLAADRWLVRFDGFGPEYDQQVTGDRFRPRGGGSIDPLAGSPAAPTPTPAPPPAEPSPPPPSTPSPSAASPSAASKAAQANDEVLVAHRGVYHLAVLIGPGSAGRARVRYRTSAVGTESSSPGGDEEVAADRVIRAAQLGKGARFELNQNVFVEYHGVYFAGRITKIPEKGQFRIRYENFGPEADEIIPARRLRPRP